MLNKMFNNKRGNFVDIAEWLRFAIVFSILVGVMLSILLNFNTQVQLSNVSTVPLEAKQASANLANSVPQGMDYLFLFGTLIFFISSAVFARLIPSSSKLIIIAVIFLIIFPMLAMFLENVWDGWIQQSQIAIAFADLIFLPFIMNNLRYFALFYTLVVGIALYTKADT